MLQSVLSNLCVILLSHLIISQLVSNREKFGQLTLRYLILLMTTFTVISMFYLPIQIGEYIFDLRLIPLIMLALFSGWSNTVIVLLAASVWRFFIIGGTGAIPGVLFGMVLPTTFTLIYAHYFTNNGKLWDKIILVTICWAISDIPLIFILPDGFSVMKQIFVMRYFSFLGAAILYYVLIELENKQVGMKTQLRFLATHDQLTGLLNKQECIRLAEMKMKSEQKNSSHFIAMIDLDHFKKLNDSYGHAAGDQALIQMAKIFKSVVNDRTLAARYGGEEFIMYFCAGSEKEAMDELSAMHNRIRHTLFQVKEDEAISVTVSIGIAQWPNDSSIQYAIKEADRKLYLAKEQGRDQIVY